MGLGFGVCGTPGYLHVSGSSAGPAVRTVCYIAPERFAHGCAAGRLDTVGLTGQHGRALMGIDRSSATISRFAQHKGAVPSKFIHWHISALTGHDHALSLTLHRGVCGKH